MYRKPPLAELPANFARRHRCFATRGDCEAAPAQLIFIHKEKMLGDVARIYPARHYVMVDDKLRLLTAIKKQWKERVTTVFVRQGHYALDEKANRRYPPADRTIPAIGRLLTSDL